MTECDKSWATLLPTKTTAVSRSSAKYFFNLAFTTCVTLRKMAELKPLRDADYRIFFINVKLLSYFRVNSFFSPLYRPLINLEYFNYPNTVPKKLLHEYYSLQLAKHLYLDNIALYQQFGSFSCQPIIKNFYR